MLAVRGGYRKGAVHGPTQDPSRRGSRRRCAGHGARLPLRPGCRHRAPRRTTPSRCCARPRAIQPGETIESAAANGKLALQPVPQAQLLPDYQTTIDALKGQVALTTVYPGEQIISDKFGGEAEADSPPADPQGAARDLGEPHRPGPGGRVREPGLGGRDLPQRADDDRPASRTPGCCWTGSRCSASGRPLRSRRRPPTRPGQQTTEQLPRTLLTLAVDQKDAQRVLYASGNGELSFALLTPDSRVKPGPGVDRRRISSSEVRCPSSPTLTTRPSRRC